MLGVVVNYYPRQYLAEDHGRDEGDQEGEKYQRKAAFGKSSYQKDDHDGETDQQDLNGRRDGEPEPGAISEYLAQKLCGVPALRVVRLARQLSEADIRQSKKRHIDRREKNKDEQNDDAEGDLDLHKRLYSD